MNKDSIKVASNKNYIFSLELIRIICALLVFLFHLNLQFGFKTNKDILDKVITSGNFTMTIFFMLSGFVLFIQYGRNNSLTDFKSIVCFYKKRIISIWPAYCFVLIFYYFGTNYNLTDSGIKNFILFPAEFLGIQCFFQDIHRFSGNDLTWFISVLLFLYLLYPFFQFLFKKYEKYRYFFAIGCYLLSGYIVLIYVFFRDAKIFYYNNPIYRVPEFVLGIVLGQIFMKDRSKIHIGGKSAVFITLLIWVGVYKLTEVIFINIPFGYMALTFDIILIPFIAVLLLAVANIKNKYVQVFCRHKIITYLGSITFTFYLTQGIMIRILRILLEKFVFSSIEMLISGFLINLFLAIALYELVQKNAKKLAIKYHFI